MRQDSDGEKAAHEAEIPAPRGRYSLYCCEVVPGEEAHRRNRDARQAAEQERLDVDWKRWRQPWLPDDDPPIKTVFLLRTPSCEACELDVYLVRLGSDGDPEIHAILA